MVNKGISFWLSTHYPYISAGNDTQNTLILWEPNTQIPLFCIPVWILNDLILHQGIGPQYPFDITDHTLILYDNLSTQYLYSAGEAYEEKDPRPVAISCTRVLSQYHDMFIKTLKEVHNCGGCQFKKRAFKKCRCVSLCKDATYAGAF